MGIGRLLMCVAALSSSAAFAQGRAKEPAPVCVASCTETCQKESMSNGCNPAVGLTSCRIKQDQCISACTRKCPHA